MESQNGVGGDNGRQMKVVYSIIERDKGQKARWQSLGVGFVNRDGSINVRLDALPTNGTLHIRDYVPRDLGGPGPSEPRRAGKRDERDGDAEALF